MNNLILGIDLGTTYSAVAYMDDNKNPAIIANELGENTTPSILYVKEENNYIVGKDVTKANVTDRSQIISFAKNYIGKTDKFGKPIVFKTPHQTLSPEAVLGIILKKITDDASKKLGRQDDIKDVVVTIPAYFNDSQRKATDDAIRLAGLNRLGFINEPTAAAYYYAKKANLNKAKILVYDLGGGTFDVSIIEIDGEKMQVLSTNGLSRVGGAYFDMEIIDYISSIIKSENQIDITDEIYNPYMTQLATQVEKAKIELSTKETSYIDVELEDYYRKIEFGRDKFEKIVEKLFQKTKSCIRLALKDANLNTDDIDRIVLVGGSSKIPYIRNNIKNLFEKEPSTDINPDEIVALGAALYAKELSVGEERKLYDVNSHGIGIRAYDPDLDSEYNDILIRKNTKLPASYEKVFLLNKGSDNVFLSIFEGEYKEISDVSEIVAINVDLEERLKEDTKIRLRLEIDKYQMLHIYLCLDNKTRSEREIHFSRQGLMTEAMLSDWKKRITTANIKERRQKAGRKIPRAVESVMKEIVGMDEVKTGLRDYKNRYDMREKMSDYGNEVTVTNAIAVYGKPGIGLTTAALKIAEALREMGIVTAYENIILIPDKFMWESENDIQKTIKEAFEKARNGILIIDEFNELYVENDFSKAYFVMDQISRYFELSDGLVTLIIAGYSIETKKLMEKKPKFARLFVSSSIDLIGYSANEYLTILHKLAEEKGYVIDDYANMALEKYIKKYMNLPAFKHIHFLTDNILEPAITDAANQAAGLRHPTKDDYTILRLNNFRLNKNEASLEELLQELDNLTGLKEVKLKVAQMKKALEAELRAIENGLDINAVGSSRHMIFTGGAGTGKTTVARLLSQIYRELGILSSGHLVEVSRKDLVSEFVGKTAGLVNEKVKEAMGGVLFIDEAYSLCRNENDSFGKEAVDALVPLLENYRNDFVCIIAGYTNDMQAFLNSNEGLKSRFNCTINFEDYSVDELMKIIEKLANDDGMTLSKSAYESAKKIVTRRHGLKDFGNARGVRNLYEDIKRRHFGRLYDIDGFDTPELTILRDLDVISPDDAKEESLSAENALKALENMIGLDEVKDQINSLVNKARMNEQRKKNGLSSLNFTTNHMIFMGNPGTGKTSVANLISAIYKDLGVIAEDKVINVTRNDLVAGFVGQTAAKTTDVVYKALGGVLFIDEAYQLMTGGKDDFGKEAIETLIPLLENYRTDFICIMAGYTDEMTSLLELNTGLKSRFPNIITFNDFDPEEMVLIFSNMIKEEELIITDEALLELKLLIAKEAKNKDFGNARGVRNLMERIVKNMDNRLAILMKEKLELKSSDLITITVDDIF